MAHDEVGDFPAGAGRPGALPREFPGRLRGCFLGGAAGDALGAPVEFLSRHEIAARFGESGIRDFAPVYGRRGAITDDTQMALFTAEGLLRAQVRARGGGPCHPPSVLAYAYLRWLHTQGIAHPLHEICLDGWLLGHAALHDRRAPGLTCLAALRTLRSPAERAANDSKGCGGVMRAAPVGMHFASFAARAPGEAGALRADAFRLGCEAAAITHGHPTGRLAAGAFAAIVFGLLLGETQDEALDAAQALLVGERDHRETSEALEAARFLAKTRPAQTEALRELGEGWVAEETLAIGIYCAFGAPDLESGVVLAANHDGDSDSTALVAGHLLGARFGEGSIPPRWRDGIELRDVIERVADDLLRAPDWPFDAAAAGDDFRDRYPGA